MNENHIFPFLWMRGEEEQVLRTEIEKIYEAGIRSVCLEARPHPDYAGEGWWHDVDIVIDEAKKRGMTIWILDDAHFPTGMANNAMEKHQDKARRWLVSQFVDVAGPMPAAQVDVELLTTKQFTWMDFGKPVVKPLIEVTRLLSVTACRMSHGDTEEGEALDLSAYVKDGILTAVITGVVEGGDPEADAEIVDWCKAAQVRRRFRDTNLAQIGRPYPGMMDLYIDETNLYHRMWLYTKQFDWEKMWSIADDITDDEAIRAKAQDILDTFDIEGGGTIEKVWDMAKYVVAFEQWVKDEQLGFVASHYDGFAQGVAGKLDSMLIPAFSMLIKQGTACAVEGDIKVAMAMSILKTISGMGQLSEMYSIDFNEDICIIGHSGSGDADISKAKKPTMKIVPVFRGKTGGGYLTQCYPAEGDVTYLGITQDKDGYFKFVVAEGVNEAGPIFTFGDTNMRTRFTCGAREFCNRWSEAGPTHHMAAASGRWIDTILKVAKIFNVPVDIITR